MGAVNSISSVDIRGNSESLRLSSSKGVGLVCRGVGSHDGLLIDIVSVGSATAGVVERESEGVEVLLYADDGGEGVVGLVDRRGETALNQSAGD